MKQLIRAIGRFPWQRKLMVGIMVLLIILTWLAVCLILTGVLSP
jgi:hypothetical protein